MDTSRLTDTGGNTELKWFVSRPAQVQNSMLEPPNGAGATVGPFLEGRSERYRLTKGEGATNTREEEGAMDSM